MISPTDKLRDWEKEFDKKWTKVECSAHERTSSAQCICDSLSDINYDYGYDEIKNFIRVLLLSEREKTCRELLAIADAGEYEDMRREVSLLFETTKNQ